MPARMIVLMLAPSHTIRSGASADFGRLFSTTIAGSRISDTIGSIHSRMASRIPQITTSAKLINVSESVTPMCMVRLPS